MIQLSGGIQSDSSMPIQEREKGHPDSTSQKIQTLVQSVHLCTQISETTNTATRAVTISDTRGVASIVEDEQKAQEQYLMLDEARHLLGKRLFKPSQTQKNIKDDWCNINNTRSVVSEALNQGLSQLILKYTKPDDMIVEFGSGIGYDFTSDLTGRIIRTQKQVLECQLLSRSISDPIYLGDIETVCDSLAKSGKKIPLFFGLNIFDVLSPESRRKSLVKISQLQNINDHILILLDIHPFIEAMVDNLRVLHPKHVVLPFFQTEKPESLPEKLSLILVPDDWRDEQPDSEQIAEMIFNELNEILMGKPVSNAQQTLNEELKSDRRFIAVDMEEFFIEQVTKELNEVGYQAKASYHNSFVAGTPSEVYKSNQLLLYKSQNDTMTVRQWDPSDSHLQKNLSKKNLPLPNTDARFLASMKAQGKTILGAEILAIEAQKIR